MRLKKEVHIRTKLNPFTGGHCQQSVVIQNWVQRFDPFRINVTITDDPRLDIDWFTNDLPGSIRQNSVRPLASVHVNLSKKLLAEWDIQISGNDNKQTVVLTAVSIWIQYQIKKTTTNVNKLTLKVYLFTLAFLNDDEISKLSRILYDQAYGCAFKCIMLRVFQKTCFQTLKKTKTHKASKY